MIEVKKPDRTFCLCAECQRLAVVKISAGQSHKTSLILCELCIVDLCKALSSHVEVDADNHD